MTVTEDFFRDAISADVSKNVEEDSIVEKLSFSIIQHERSSLIPRTTQANNFILSQSAVSESSQGRIVFKEVDDRFIQWVGRVLEINGDSFTARIDPIRQRSTSKIAKFNIKKLTVLNGEQMEEGSTFYWTVGLFRDSKGSLVRKSEIRFRLPIVPNKQAVDELALIKAQELFDGIKWLE